MGLPGSYGDSYSGTSGTGLLNPISFLGDRKRVHVMAGNDFEIKKKFRVKWRISQQVTEVHASFVIRVHG